MAFTRKMLKALGIEDDKVDQIMEAHVEVTDALKQRAEDAEGRAREADELRSQLEAAKGGEDLGAKYEAEHKAFEAFKAKVEADRAEAEKRGLYRGLLAKAGVDPKRIESVLRVSDLSKVSVKDGAIEGGDELVKSIQSDWADFVVQTKTEGANVAHPVINDGGGGSAPSTLADALRERFK